MAAERIRVQAREDAPEFVVQGNLRAEKQRGYYETDDSRFAQWLADEYGVEPMTVAEESEDIEAARGIEDEYPEDFPARHIFIKQEIPIATTRELTRDQLIEINDIGETRADRVLAYFAREGE